MKNALVTLAIPYIDPRRARFVQFADTYRVIRTLVVATMLGLELLHVTWIRHSGLGSVGLPAMYGVMFVALGIYLPKVQSNFFVGVRTPWTLSSEESWRRTHKLAGWLFGIGGVVTTAIAIVAPEAGMPAMFTTLGVAAITSIVYSYLVWRTAADRTEAGKI